MKILIADDDAVIRAQLQTLLGGEHTVQVCEDGASALRFLDGGRFDLVITDNVMPGLTGLELIRRGKSGAPETAFLLMTATGSVAQAVEAIQFGADDYIVKPFSEAEIKHRVSRIGTRKSARPALTPAPEKAGQLNLIGKSTSVAAAKKFIQNVSPVTSPVLILGPSGSGKEVVARSIHLSGPRTSKPFIAVNCASLSEQLMESELFGHEKGAFTGAVATKPGKFELAKGGTLFLDEIGELTPSVQARLLRVIQEKVFSRVGGVAELKADARIITATHRDLKAMTRTGGFREDLLFRLDVLSFTLAPLRERTEDIQPLIEFFWSKLSAELERSATLSPGVLELLGAYPFPGNVRELQNILERLMVMSPPQGEIQPEALPAEIQEGAKLKRITSPVESLSASGESSDIRVLGLNGVVERLEAKVIQEAMQECGGNQVKTAELLKITRGALQYKLKKYGIGQSEAA